MRPNRLLPLAAAALLVAGCLSFDTSQIPGLTELASLVENPEPSELSVREDRDGDGLSNEEEDALGTDHANPDTDGDGNDDFLELALGTDPRTAQLSETTDGVPPGFDGAIQPGETHVFERSAEASRTGYVRLMGLVRQRTRVRINWQETPEGEPTTLATTLETFDPRTYWCWGHDLGAQAIVVDPADMTVTRLEVTVLEGGDSVLYQFISSAGLENGPRGLVPFPADLAEADLDFTLLLAHGLADEAATWDAFAIMLERISPDARVLRTDVEPQGSVSERAGQLARYLLRQDPDEVYAVAHSMGGLDLRYILTEAAQGHGAFVDAAATVQVLYTIATPHQGAFLAALADELPELADVLDTAAPAIIDLQPGSRALTELNEAFDGDVTIDGRVVPVIALAFHADSTLFTQSDGVVELTSQAFGDHVVSDIPSTRGAGLGGGKHTHYIPTRADTELQSYEVLGWILSDIVARRGGPDLLPGDGILPDGGPAPDPPAGVTPDGTGEAESA